MISDASSARPTGCALAAAPPIDGKHIVAESDAEKGTILLDAKRRPLQARVGRMRLHGCFCHYVHIFPTTGVASGGIMPFAVGLSSGGAVGSSGKLGSLSA